MRVYLRHSIPLQRSLVDACKKEGVIVTRRSHFKRSGVVINHGDSRAITIGRRVKRLYVLNSPDIIRFAKDKQASLKSLRDFYPETLDSLCAVTLPCLVKPRFGRASEGIVKCDSVEELSEVLRWTRRYIVQELVENVTSEFRFNVFNSNVYQVSRKEKQSDGGFVYTSLGPAAELSEAFWQWARDCVDAIDTATGGKLVSYALDVIRQKGGHYYLCEVNSAYGLKGFTAKRFVKLVKEAYEEGALEEYRVK